jgi:hypothetical protein
MNSANTAIILIVLCLFAVMLWAGIEIVHDDLTKLIELLK